MELKTLDLFIIITLHKHKGLDLRELSIKLMLDMSVISKSLTKLNKQKLVYNDESRPKKYYCNNELFKKWMKNN